MTSRALARLAAAALALAAAAGCARVRPPPGPAGLAPGYSRRALVVRGHGRILIALPPGWSAAEGEEGEGPAQTIRIEKRGEKFLVLLTPLWNPAEPEPPQARADTARLFAELGRRRALAGSVEHEIPLEELEGPGVRGAWFASTDAELMGRESSPDEFRHVLQGAAAVGPVILAFSVLDDGPGPWRAETLDLVRGARHVPDGEPEAELWGDLEPVPEEAALPLRLRWPGKAWSLLVDLPGFRVGVRPAEAGAPYAIGLHPETGIAASVVFAPARGAADAAACRDRALATLSSASPGLAFVRSEASGSARAAYDLAAGKAGLPESHAHLFLFRDGVCVSVHASKVGPERGDAARLEEILSSARIAEDL
jgi:hypothetical protein